MVTNAAKVRLLHRAHPGTILMARVVLLLGIVCLAKTAMSALQANKFNVLQDSTHQVRLTTARHVHPDTTVQMLVLAHPLLVPVASIQMSRQQLALHVQPITLQPVVKQVVLQYPQDFILQRPAPNTQELPSAVKQLSVTGVTMIAQFVQTVTFVLKKVSSTGGNKAVHAVLTA